MPAIFSLVTNRTTTIKSRQKILDIGRDRSSHNFGRSEPYPASGNCDKGIFIL